MADENQLQQEMEALRDSLQRGAGDLNKFGDSARNAEVGVQAFNSAAKQGAKDTLKSIGGFGKAVGDGATSFATLNPLIDTVSNAMSGLAKSIPFAGEALAAGVKATAEASKFIIDQLDKTAKTFNELGQVGALTAKGMTGVQEQFLRSGMSLDGFKRVVTENANSLARFGGIVGEGADSFSKSVGKLLDDNNEAGMALRNIGLNADQIGETAAAFLKQQTLLGRQRTLTEEQLRQGTVAYAKELDDLSKLTGLSKKSLQSQQDAALSETRFLASQLKLRNQGRDTEAEEIKKFQSQVSALGETYSQGVRDLASGNSATEAARQVQNATSGEAAAILQRLRDGQMNSVQAQSALQAAVQRNIPSMIELGNAAGDTVTAFPKLKESVAIASAQYDDAGNLTKKLTETQAAQMSGQDDLTNSTVSAQRQMELLNRQISAFGFGLTKHAAPAIEAFTKSLNDFLQYVSKVTGVPIPGISGAGASGTAAPPAPPSVQVRQQADTAAIKVADLADQEQAAKAKINELVLARADKAKIDEATAALETLQKQKIAAEQAEIKQANEARQLALEEKNARLQANKVRNTITLQERSQADAQKAVDKLKLEQAQLEVQKRDNASTDSVRMQADRDLMLKGVAEDLAKAEKKLKERTDAVTKSREELKKLAPPPKVSGTTAEKIIQVESGGRNIGNIGGTSTAHGLGQFTKGTFESVAKMAKPGEALYGKTFEDYKKDTGLQKVALDKLIETNKGSLTKANLPTTDSAVYLAHFLGAGGASKVLRASDSTPISQVVGIEQIQANQQLFAKIKTVGDLKAWADKKMGGTGYDMDTSVATATTTPPQAPTTQTTPVKPVAAKAPVESTPPVQPVVATAPMAKAPVESTPPVQPVVATASTTQTTPVKPVVAKAPTTQTVPVKSVVAKEPVEPTPPVQPVVAKAPVELTPPTKPVLAKAPIAPTPPVQPDVSTAAAQPTAPVSGYKQALTPEITVPMSQSKGVSSEAVNITDNMRTQNDLLTAQVMKLGELVEIMKTTNSINSKILQVSRA